MATPDQILALLRGTKIFDGISWRVYDDYGTELTHGPVHWGGVHGALLTQVALAAQTLLSGAPVLYQQMLDAGRSKNAPPARDYLSENLIRLHKAREAVPKTAPDEYNLTSLHEEDTQIAEFIIALVTKGFMNGNVQG